MAMVPYNTLTGGGYTGGTNPLTNTAQEYTLNNPLYYEPVSMLDPSGSPVSGGGGGGGGISSEDAKLAEFINKSYDTKISGLRSNLSTLKPQQDAAVLNVNNQYTNQGNALKSQQAIGQRNLGIAGEQVQSGKVRGLADLGRQVQTMGMSYNNQLGAFGAGDSSATGLVQQALSGMASRNRSDVLSSAGEQQRGIDLQTQDLNTEFENNSKMLDDWKSSSLNDIATRFLQQRQAIQQQMQTADADRYQQLAQLDASYANQAIAELGQLENQYKQSSQDLIQRFQSIQGPKVGIASNLQQYAVKPISAGKISQMSMAPSVSAGNQPTAYSARRPFEEDYGFGF